MGFGVALLFGMMVSLWLIARATRAGYGRFVFWLLWSCFGLAPVFLMPGSSWQPSRVLAWVYAGGMVGLPAWWVAYNGALASRGGP